MIDGAHEVFTENPEMTEKILFDFCRVKAPQKFFLMNTIKQSLGLGVFKASLTMLKSQMSNVPA